MIDDITGVLNLKLVICHLNVFSSLFPSRVAFVILKTLSFFLIHSLQESRNYKNTIVNTAKQKNKTFTLFFFEENAK